MKAAIVSFIVLIAVSVWCLWTMYGNPHTIVGYAEADSWETPFGVLIYTWLAFAVFNLCVAWLEVRKYD